MADRLAARDVLFGQARMALLHELAPRLKTISIRSVERVKLDNAVLMSRRVYLTDLDAFDAVLAKDGGDLRRAVKDIIAVAKADTAKRPFDAVKRFAGLPVPPSPRDSTVAADSAQSSAGQRASADSVLLTQELDGVAGADRLVAELRPMPGHANDGTPQLLEHRVALYLGSARSPAWSSGWNDMSTSTLRSALPLAGGGSLLTIDVESGDGGEVLVVFARHDSARVVLRQGGDYDGWLLRTRQAGGRVLAEVGGFMVHNDSSTSPSIRCEQPRLAGWTFAFDEKAGEFVKERELCLTH